VDISSEKTALKIVDVPLEKFCPKKKVDSSMEKKQPKHKDLEASLGIGNHEEGAVHAE
jgi:hypothetical protein